MSFHKTLAQLGVRRAALAAALWAGPGGGRREDHLSAPCAAEPAGVRALGARQASRLLQGGRLRRGLRGGARRRRRGQADRRRQCGDRRRDRRHPDHRARQRRAGEGGRPDGRRRAHRGGRPQGPRHREARRPARQEDLRARLPGHDLLRAAGRARLQEHHQERRQRPGGRAGRGREPSGRRHRRRLRLHAGLGDQRQGRRRRHGVAADQGLLPVDVAGDPGLRQDDRRAARHGARHRQGDAARHEVRDGRSRARPRSPMSRRRRPSRARKS